MNAIEQWKYIMLANEINLAERKPMRLVPKSVNSILDL